MARTPRRKRDQYFTPEDAVATLLARIPITPHQTVLEPCVGSGNIAAPLICHGNVVFTNDIDSTFQADTYMDATDPLAWPFFQPADWVISNTPFSHAPQITPLAYDYAAVGIALLLRLSYLEPCLNRDTWLATHPLSGVIPIPRISFTGDGKTDQVATAWFVWLKSGATLTPPIDVVPRCR